MAGLGLALLVVPAPAPAYVVEAITAISAAEGEDRTRLEDAIQAAIDEWPPTRSRSPPPWWRCSTPGSSATGSSSSSFSRTGKGNGWSRPSSRSDLQERGTGR